MTMTAKTPLFTLALALALAGCGQVEDPRSLFAPDLAPPTILSASTIDSRSFAVVFDEEAFVKPSSLSLGPGLTLAGLEPRGNAAILRFAADQSPGKEYRVEGVAVDASGNSLGFSLSFLGHNPRLAGMLVNEFRTDSAKGKGDLVEFLATSDGNAAGAVFCPGTQDSADFLYVFPPIELRKGEYLVLHLKPSADPGACDDSTSPRGFRGAETSDEAWDLWCAQDQGLSKNNGCLALYSSRNGKAVDAVFYTNRSSSSDEAYGGFGSKALRRAVEEFVAEGQWRTAGSLPVPEDGVPSADVTSSRSLCRSSASGDTDSKADWHLSPTKGSSFGMRNGDDAYLPKAPGPRASGKATAKKPK
jgi:hypothetical protein